MDKFYIEKPSTEGKYRRLAKLGAELGIPIPECFLEMEVTLPGGKIIHHHKQRSHSWVRNYYNLIFIETTLARNWHGGAATFGPGYVSYKSVDGAVVSTSQAAEIGTRDALSPMVSSNDAGYNAIAGYGERGIVIGSDNTPESFEHHILAARIVHGNGAGQMSYGDTVLPVLTYNAGTKTLSDAIIRYFNNNSGEIINVQECGLYAWSGSMSRIVMFNRDVFAAVPIPNTGQLKVTYIFNLVYPN